MNVSDLREKSDKDLHQQLLELRKEQFNLRMQSATAQLPRPHQFKQLRKDIARIKTVISARRAETKAK